MRHVPSEAETRLRRLWDQHRAQPAPFPDERDPRAQEIALYGSWLGSLVEAALARGGTLSEPHRRMLAVRRAEEDPSVWRAASELGDPARSYVARLLAMEEALESLPRTNDGQ